MSVIHESLWKCLPPDLTWYCHRPASKYKEYKMQEKGSRHSGAWKKLLQASCRSPSRYSQMCLQPYSMGEQGSGRSAQSLWWKYQIRKYREHKYKWEKIIPISGIQKYYSNVMFAAKWVNRICAITLKKDANLWSWHLLLKVWCHTHGGGIYTKRVRDWAISFSVSFGALWGMAHTVLIHYIAFRQFW